MQIIDRECRESLIYPSYVSAWCMSKRKSHRFLIHIPKLATEYCNMFIINDLCCLDGL